MLNIVSWKDYFVFVDRDKVESGSPDSHTYGERLFDPKGNQYLRDPSQRMFEMFVHENEAFRLHNDTLLKQMKIQGYAQVYDEGEEKGMMIYYRGGKRGLRKVIEDLFNITEQYTGKYFGPKHHLG